YQPNNGVDGPGMQTPMEEGDAHGLAGVEHGGPGADGRVDKVHDRLGYTEEHQANSHAGGEQHGKPGYVTVVGPAVVGAKLDVAIAADGKKNDRKQNNRHGQHVEPAYVG